VASVRIGVAIAILLFTGVAVGQGKPALRVVLDGIGPEAAACGISGPAIQAVAARTLKSHGINVSTDAADPYLYVNLNAYRVMQGETVVGCATRLGVSVRAATNDATVRGFKPKTEAYVVVCEAGRLLSGAQRELPGAVNKAFEQDIKSCLSQLRY
jgi:hypothetical protein